MNTPYITAILAVTALSFSAAAMAENMSKSEYKAAGKQIAAEYKSNRMSCISFAREYMDDCMAEAKRTAKAEKADLEATYKSSTKTSNETGVTRQKRIPPFPHKSVMSLQETSNTLV